MTERREQVALRAMKANFTPYWQNDHADGFRLDAGVLFFEGRYDAGTNAVTVQIKLFVDSQDALQTFSYESPDYSVDVRAIAAEWIQQQMKRYIVKILEVKV